MSVDTSTADPLVGTVLDGRYRLDAPIARGGMATVYEAFDTRLDRTVAVKLMHPGLAADETFVERFRREAKAVARLSHPSVVAIYDQGEDAGRVYLVMEHVSGRTLRELLRGRGRLPAAQALDVTAGVLDALAAAHAAGLVHRDVKPENVLVTPSGAVKVADFGLARAVETTAYSVVADGTLLGTMAYLAPEQVVSGAADARADIYALGVVLFEMVTGTVPFTGDTPLAVAYQHVNEDVPAPSTVAADTPPGVDEVVRAATRRDADERYPDAQAMLSAVRRVRASLGNTETAVIRLDEAPTLVTKLPAVVPVAPPAKGAPSGAPPAAPPGAARARRRPRPWVVFVSIAALILLVAGVTGWYLGTGRFTSAPPLLRLDRATAATALRDAGLRLRVGEGVHSDTVPKGEVAEQDPGPGERVKRGSIVTINLSLGVRMVKVPNVEGKTVDEATKLLAKADLGRGAVANRYHDTVPRGRVISASEPPGTSVPHDTKVSLVVSDGPAPVAVPDVRGRPVDEARGALRAANLAVAVREEFSDTVPAGRVIDQTPAPAASVARGATVTLRVSKGPELVTVPDVRGEDIDRVTPRLEALGLVVTVEHVRNGRGDIVLDQDPPGGTKVKRGTRVTLVAF